MSMMWRRVKCLLGYHDLEPSFNARFDVCIHCKEKIGVV